MRVVDLITKKRDGFVLTQAEINYLIEGYVSGDIPDYQMSALLMAIYFVPLTDEETFHFTQAMLKSGESIDLSQVRGIKVDKHSTGGVGDKTSLVVAALAAAAGVKMAKMSGRGLGHTGGTLDKLEAIPGFQIELTPQDFFKQVNEIGLAIIGQSANITPADKKMYALRDVTATIESTGLIAASIMSKKLASGADNIVLDVKVGSGAFMKDLKEAEKLAEAMVAIGKNAKRATVATLTDMEQPLGWAVGNALEDIEAIETLKGHGPADFTALCYSLTSEILQVASIVSNDEDAYTLIKHLITSKAALEKLRQMIKYQGGDEKVIDDYTLFPTAKEQINVYYHGQTQYVEHINALHIGEAAMLLGAGRLTKDDKVDLSVGVVLRKKVGDEVNDGEILAVLHTNGLNTLAAKVMVEQSYTFTTLPVKKRPVVLKTIR